MAIEIISASAGTGKTHRLAEILVSAVEGDRVRPEAVVATTFTNRAAAELIEVRPDPALKGNACTVEIAMDDDSMRNMNAATELILWT